MGKGHDCTSKRVDEAVMSGGKAVGKFVGLTWLGILSLPNICSPSTFQLSS